VSTRTGIPPVPSRILPRLDLIQARTLRGADAILPPASTPRAKRQYTVSDKVRAANRANLAWGNP